MAVFKPGQTSHPEQEIIFLAATDSKMVSIQTGLDGPACSSAAQSGLRRFRKGQDNAFSGQNNRLEPGAWLWLH